MAWCNSVKSKGGNDNSPNAAKGEVYTKEMEDDLSYSLDKLEELVLSFLTEFSQFQSYDPSDVETPEVPDLFNLKNKIQLMNHLLSQFDPRIQNYFKVQVLNDLSELASKPNSNYNEKCLKPLAEVREIMLQFYRKLQFPTYCCKPPIIRASNLSKFIADLKACPDGFEDPIDLEVDNNANVKNAVFSSPRVIPSEHYHKVLNQLLVQGNEVPEPEPPTTVYNAQKLEPNSVVAAKEIDLTDPFLTKSFRGVPNYTCGKNPAKSFLLPSNAELSQKPGLMGYLGESRKLGISADSENIVDPDVFRLLTGNDGCCGGGGYPNFSNNYSRMMNHETEGILSFEETIQSYTHISRCVPLLWCGIDPEGNPLLYPAKGTCSRVPVLPLKPLNGYPWSNVVGGTMARWEENQRLMDKKLKEMAEQYGDYGGFLSGKELGGPSRFGREKNSILGSLGLGTKQLNRFGKSFANTNNPYAPGTQAWKEFNQINGLTDTFYGASTKKKIVGLSKTPSFINDSFFESKKLQGTPSTRSRTKAFGSRKRQAEELGNPLQNYYQTDEFGNMIHDKSGNPIPVKRMFNTDGTEFTPSQYETHRAQSIKGNRGSIHNYYQTDESGNIVHDKAGHPIPIKRMYNSDGSEFTPAQYDKHRVQVLKANGGTETQNYYQTDQSGNVMYDKAGHPIPINRLYNQDGSEFSPAQYDKHRAQVAKSIGGNDMKSYFQTDRFGNVLHDKSGHPIPVTRLYNKDGTEYTPAQYDKHRTTIHGGGSGNAKQNYYQTDEFGNTLKDKAGHPIPVKRMYNSDGSEFTPTQYDKHRAQSMKAQGGSEVQNYYQTDQFGNTLHDKSGHPIPLKRMYNQDGSEFSPAQYDKHRGQVMQGKEGHGHKKGLGKDMSNMNFTGDSYMVNHSQSVGGGGRHRKTRMSHVEEIKTHLRDGELGRDGANLSRKPTLDYSRLKTIGGGAFHLIFGKTLMDADNPSGKPIMEENYKNTNIPFSSIYKNGAVRINYPNGKPAILTSGTKPTFQILVLDGDDKIESHQKMNILAAFDTSGEGIVYGPEGNILFEYDNKGGRMYDKYTGTYKSWDWAHYGSNHPPKRLVLNPYITLEITDLNRMDLVYEGGGRNMRLNIGKDQTLLSSVLSKSHMEISQSHKEENVILMKKHGDRSFTKTSTVKVTRSQQNTPPSKKPFNVRDNIYNAKTTKKDIKNRPLKPTSSFSTTRIPNHYNNREHNIDFSKSERFNNTRLGQSRGSHSYTNNFHAPSPQQRGMDRTANKLPRANISHSMQSYPTSQMNDQRKPLKFLERKPIHHHPMRFGSLDRSLNRRTKGVESQYHVRMALSERIADTDKNRSKYFFPLPKIEKLGHKKHIHEHGIGIGMSKESPRNQDIFNRNCEFSPNRFSKRRSSNVIIPFPEHVLAYVQKTFPLQEWPFGAPIAVRTYPNGDTFCATFANGSGEVFYPHGGVAILVSSPNPVNHVLIIRDPVDKFYFMDKAILADIDCNGKGCVFNEDGIISMQYNSVGGFRYEGAGKLTHRWTWNRGGQRMITKLNRYITLRILDLNRIHLVFNGNKRGVRFNVGPGRTINLMNVEIESLDALAAKGKKEQGCYEDHFDYDRGKFTTPILGFVDKNRYNLECVSRPSSNCNLDITGQLDGCSAAIEDNLLCSCID